MILRAAVLLLILLVMGGSDLGGQTQKPPDPPSPPTPPVGGNPSKGQDNRRPNNRPRTILLAGRVTLTDGSAPNEPIPVEFRCNGNARRQVWTTVNGQFSFRLGGTHSFQAYDATVSPRASLSPFDLSNDTIGGFGGSGSHDPSRAINLSGCEIRAAAAGYRSSTIVLGVRSALDNPDVGTVVMERRRDVSGTLVSVTTLAAPKKARKAYKKAQKELDRKKPDLGRAGQLLSEAVTLYPKMAAAWHLWGQVRSAEGNSEGALEAFARATEAEPKLIGPNYALGQIALQQKEYAEADTHLTYELSLDPNATHARFSLALTHYYLGRLEEAERGFRQVESSPEAQQYPGIHYALGLVHAEQGDYPTAADELRKHLELFPEGKVAEAVTRQLNVWEEAKLISPAKEKLDQ